MSVETEFSDPRRPANGWDLWYEHPAVRWGILVLAIAGVAALAWLLTSRSSSDGLSSAGQDPVATTQQDLAARSDELHQPVYWAGVIPRTNLALTKNGNDYSYVRYLPEGTAVDDPSPDFLTVATYPAPNAFRDLRNYSRDAGAQLVHIGHGGVALRVPKSPTSVYFAYPSQDVQVEVYDPHRGRALELVRTGQVQPVRAP
jgi:hypothetical protein